MRYKGVVHPDVGLGRFLSGGEAVIETREPPAVPPRGPESPSRPSRRLSPDRASWRRPFPFGRRNRTKFFYDAKGNQVRQHKWDGFDQYFQFNDENMLTRALYQAGTHVYFIYNSLFENAKEVDRADPAGIQMYFDYDKLNKIHVRDASGSCQERLILGHSPVPYDPRLVKQEDIADDVSRTCHADELGTVLELRKSDQSVAGSYLLDAFGNILSSPQFETQRYHFHAREYVDSLGLYAMLFRKYNSLSCRWLSRDRLKTLRRYIAFLNNPLSSDDMLGLQDKRTFGDDPPSPVVPRVVLKPIPEKVPEGQTALRSFEVSVVGPWRTKIIPLEYYISQFGFRERFGCESKTPFTTLTEFWICKTCVCCACQIMAVDVQSSVNQALPKEKRAEVEYHEETRRRIWSKAGNMANATIIATPLPNPQKNCWCEVGEGMDLDAACKDADSHYPPDQFMLLITLEYCENRAKRWNVESARNDAEVWTDLNARVTMGKQLSDMERLRLQAIETAREEDPAYLVVGEGLGPEKMLAAYTFGVGGIDEEIRLRYTTLGSGASMNRLNEMLARGDRAGAMEWVEANTYQPRR